MKEGIISRLNCPTCSSFSSKTIFNRSFNEPLIKKYMELNYGGKADIEFLKDVAFEIVKCNTCNLSYQKYVLNEDRSKELYDKWVDPVLVKELNINRNPGKNRTYTFILNFAVKHLKKKPSEIKVLDYGAGLGDSLLLASEMGFDSYAYEFSSERISFLKEKGIKTIDNKDEMLFDLIIINQILEHLTNPDEVLKLVLSKLKETGLIYIGVPNCQNIEKKLKKTSTITEVKELHGVLLNASVGAFQHINFYSNNNLKLLFKKHELNPVNPFKQFLIRPLSLKSLIRPFYKYYFGTSFFLTKH